MTQRLFLFFRQNRLLLVLFLVAIIAAGAFAVRMGGPPPGMKKVERDQVIEAWMTPRFVSRSWQVPREVMETALGPPPNESFKRTTLKALAKSRDVPVEDLIDALNAAITAHRAAQ